MGDETFLRIRCVRAWKGITSWPPRAETPGGDCIVLKYLLYTSGKFEVILLISLRRVIGVMTTWRDFT